MHICRTFCAIKKPMKQSCWLLQPGMSNQQDWHMQYSSLFIFINSFILDLSIIKNWPCSCESLSIVQVWPQLLPTGTTTPIKDGFIFLFLSMCLINFRFQVCFYLIANLSPPISPCWLSVIRITMGLNLVYMGIFATKIFGLSPSFLIIASRTLL